MWSNMVSAKREVFYSKKRVSIWYKAIKEVALPKEEIGGKSDRVPRLVSFPFLRMRNKCHSTLLQQLREMQRAAMG
ncbi:hypothetical protein V6N13_047225 [Hibiscus sabdariffa]